MKTIDPKTFDPNTQAYPFDNKSELPFGVSVDASSVTFTGQHGPINEVGLNGCQIDDMIQFARLTLEVFNAKFPCRENSLAITKLQEAEMWLLQRKLNREARGVEGKNVL